MAWWTVRTLSVVSLLPVNTLSCVTQSQLPLTSCFANSRQQWLPRSMRGWSSSLRTEGCRAMPRRKDSMKGRMDTCVRTCYQVSLCVYSCLKEQDLSLFSYHYCKLDISCSFLVRWSDDMTTYLLTNWFYWQNDPPNKQHFFKGFLLQQPLESGQNM